MISWPITEPVLVDQSLMLRPWHLDDVPAVYEICQDPTIQEFTTVPVPYTKEIADFWIRTSTQKYLEREKISLAGIRNGEIVLAVSIHGIHEFDHVGEIGYWVSPNARGEGLAALAVKMISDFGFAIGFRRLFAITLPDNLASQKSLVNAGFELETVLRDRMTRRNGTQANAIVFAKFPDVKIAD
jgi:RimJ/RimL family protein N-acetyltransferase